MMMIVVMMMMVIVVIWVVSSNSKRLIEMKLDMYVVVCVGVLEDREL